MSRRVIGVREIVRGERYEINYTIGDKRYQYRIQAPSITSAYNQRLIDMAERSKALNMSEDEIRRLNADFTYVWEKLYADILSDDLPPKTLHRYKKVYWRLFGDFREMKFSFVENVGQVNLPFFKEYKSYYVNKLGRVKGWRAELIIVKAIMHRLYGLGFCDKEIIEKLKEMKKPRPNKKEYPNISNTRIRELLGFIKKDRLDYYPIIYFICRTGRRINETTLIERKDIEWLGIKPVKINIRAETTKTGQDAPLVKLDKELEQVIKESYKASLKHKAPYLFCNQRGRKCTPGRVRDYLKRISKKITGVELTPHYFRHRFLTECGKANVPLVDVKAISGIKDTQVLLQYYSHCTAEGQDKVLGITRL